MRTPEKRVRGVENRVSGVTVAPAAHVNNFTVSPCKGRARKKLFRQGVIPFHHSLVRVP